MPQIQQCCELVIRERTSSDFIFSQLPTELVEQVAISSVVSREPLKIVLTRWDGWKIDNTTDFNLAMSRINKTLHRICSKAFHSENIWSFSPGSSDSAGIFREFSAFTEDLGRDKTRLIKRLMFTGSSATCFTRKLHSVARYYTGLKEIIIDLSETDGNYVNIYGLRILFSWIRSLEVISFINARPPKNGCKRGLIRCFTMETSKTQLIRDMTKATVVRDDV